MDTKRKIGYFKKIVEVSIKLKFGAFKRLRDEYRKIRTSDSIVTKK